MGYMSMKELEKLSKTVTDILECRIEAVLNDMSITALCDLPEDEAVTAEKFLEFTTDVVESASEYLATQSQLVESAVGELVDALKGKLGSPESDNINAEDGYPCPQP